jgi:hypothetical protein
MANSGGAWDNAKKSVEDEPRNLSMDTGKGSERHKASVVGDTVGDPLKDTAGPALNPMIKVVNLVSLIVAPIIVGYSSASIGMIVVIVVLGVGIVWAIMRTKKHTELFMAKQTPLTGHHCFDPAGTYQPSAGTACADAKEDASRRPREDSRRIEDSGESTT